MSPARCPPIGRFPGTLEGDFLPNTPRWFLCPSRSHSCALSSEVRIALKEGPPLGSRSQLFLYFLGFSFLPADPFLLQPTFIVNNSLYEGFPPKITVIFVSWSDPDWYSKSNVPAPQLCFSSEPQMHTAPPRSPTRRKKRGQAGVRDQQNLNLSCLKQIMVQI